MAAWDATTALSSLRSLLGDHATDKFEFKASCFPTPDGIVQKFFVGQTRVVDDTLEVFVGGVATAVSGTPDYDQGCFNLASAPSGVELQASFHYQWFTDAELGEFLTAAASLLGFETVSDSGLPVGVRASVLDFACYYAYMRKAAEWADSLTASAAGYTADQSKSHPNWRALAETAMKNGQAKLKVYTDQPLATVTPAMKFVRYRLYPYQGR